MLLSDAVIISNSSRSVHFQHLLTFDASIDAMINGLIDLCAGNHAHSRILLEEGRLLTMIVIIGSYADPATCTNASRMTLTRLQQTMKAFGAISRNRIEAVVAYLERYGFVMRCKSAEDRRLSQIIPTDKLWALDASYLDIILASASARDFCPPPHSLSTKRKLHHRLRRLMLDRLVDICALRKRHPDIMQFAERESGYLILLLLLREANARAPYIASFDYGRAAKQACVSRTHVRLLIERAERNGLLTRAARGGRQLRLTPRLLSEATQWFSENLTLHSQLLRAATEDATIS